MKGGAAVRYARLAVDAVGVLGWAAAALLALEPPATAAQFEHASRVVFGLCGLFVLALATRTIVERRHEISDRRDREQRDAGRIAHDRRILDDNKALLTDNATLHAKLDEYHGRELHNVRDRAQQLSDDLKGYLYACKQAGEEPDVLHRFAFRDRISEVVQAFERHAISDQPVAILLSSNYLDLDAFADGLDRMVAQADEKQDASKNIQIALKKQQADIDALKEQGKVDLVKRLFQVQSDIHGLTRSYHIKQSEFQMRPLSERENPISRAAELSRMEGGAVLTYFTRHEVEMMFVLQELRRHGFEPDQDFEEILAGGCSNATDLDGVAAGLHRLIKLVNQRGW
jgi:hypothetical protein